MLMLREDNKSMLERNDSKYALAIKKNNNCLREFYKKEAA